MVNSQDHKNVSKNKNLFFAAIKTLYKQTCCRIIASRLGWPGYTVERFRVGKMPLPFELAQTVHLTGCSFRYYAR